MPIVAKSMLLFVLAGLCEIGGGYLVWQWWRAGAHWGAGVVGALVLVLYGIVPTYQPAHFGRVYSAYGGWFVVLSSRSYPSSSTSSGPTSSRSTRRWMGSSGKRGRRTIRRRP